MEEILKLLPTLNIIELRKLTIEVNKAYLAEIRKQKHAKSKWPSVQKK